jgi:hypothetical protein
MTDAIDDEVVCVDCGCDLIRHEDEVYATGIRGAPRCDTDDYHHHQLCGADCPVICDVCYEHHFNGCYGTPEWRLHDRVYYGGRKGRAAARRLHRRLKLWRAWRRHHPQQRYITLANNSVGTDR